MLLAELCGVAVGQGAAHGGVHNPVPQTKRQRLVNSLETVEDDLHLCKSIGHQLQYSKEHCTGLDGRRPSLISTVGWRTQCHWCHE